MLFLRCMAGSNNRPPHCRELLEQIGCSVRCAIYASRPSPCREFRMSGEEGPSERRVHYVLPPLARPAAQWEIIMTHSPRNDALGCQAVD